MTITPDTLTLLGAGYTARALARRLRETDWRINGSVREKRKAEMIVANGIAPFVWNNDFIKPEHLGETTAILVSTPPADAGCPALNALRHAIITEKAPQPSDIRWLGYLSSNGVYGDHNGAWVHEKSAMLATSERSKRRIKAERLWRDFADEHELPLTIYRLPGIYGPGRSAIDTVRSGNAKRIYKPGQVFNRMHVDDIARVLATSLHELITPELVNLSDDEPSPPQDVIEYACSLLGVEPPPLVPIEQAQLSPMAASFYTDNKRISNALMKKTFGLDLEYPSYREGLRAIYEDE
ncbi:MAG: SDR family oxidoreductase [Marinicaulis sp.]|nr:SDR family oxidoreductase [Marinicaulis sp.]